MTPKLVHSVLCLLILVHGGMFLTGGLDLAEIGVPDPISDEAMAMAMAVGVHEIVGMFNLFLAIVLIGARSLDGKPACTMLKATTVGLASLSAGVVYHMVSLPAEMAPPAPVAVVFGLLTAWSAYVAGGRAPA